MRRREFLGVFGAAATWPLATHAQPSERTRRIAVLLPAAADDADGCACVASGHVAAAPNTPRNSRRLMHAPSG